MNKAATKPKGFTGLSDILSSGFDAQLQSADHFIKILISDIEIEEQVRGEFEDAENSLVDLGRDLAKRQLQNIIVRPNRPGREKPYLLVVGGRRVRGAITQGITELWALVADLTDVEADEVQLAENIHRKNLTQIEEARRIQRDLDALDGNVEAVLAKHNKSRPWLSKIIALLDLPEEATRLVQENISADIEVINQVRTIERIDPAAAKALVTDLKATRGEGKARQKVAEVKARVKPNPKAKAAKVKAEDASEAARVNQLGAKGNAPALVPEAALNTTYDAVYHSGSTPKKALEALNKGDKADVEAWLMGFYHAGKQATNAGSAVVKGLRAGQFGHAGAGALALVAFLQGAEREAEYSLVGILSAVKA